MDGIRNTGRKIMINLSLDKNIKVGSKVVYIDSTQNFLDTNIQQSYNHIDVSKAIGTVLLIDPIANTYQVKFDDSSFLPASLQSYEYWYIKRFMMEAL